MCIPSWVDFATLVTAFATLYLAFVTKQMVKEIKKQRESSYFPDLFVDTFSFRAYGKLNPKEDIPKFKDLDLLGENELNANPPNKYISIVILNVGLGAAKNIKYSWDFHTAKAETEIKKNAGYDKWFTNLISDININDTTELPLSIIAPSNNKTITMPFMVWAYYLYYFNIKNSSGEMKFENFPKPILKLHYSDMQNKKFKKTFEFSFWGILSNKNNTSLFTVKVNEIEREEL